MNTAKNLANCLPLLASILGNSYGTRIVIGDFSTAATDKRTVFIPAMAATVSEWANNLLRFMIDHECAHVRYTDFDAVKGLNPIEKQFENMLEDWRVENRMAGHYPGCRDHFDWGIRNFLFKEPTDMSAPADPMDVYNWVLRYIRSWDVPDLSPSVQAEAQWLEETYPGLTQPLADLLDEAKSSIRETSDCVVFARRIVNLLDYYVNQEMPEEESNQGDANSKTGKPASAKDALISFLNADDDALPKDLADQIRDALGGNGRKKSRSSDKTIHVSIPAPTVVDALTLNDIKEARKATTSLRAQLQGLLQATTLTRRVAATRGRMNYGRLHKAAYSNRIFQRKATSAGMDTCVHLLLDVSGSMGNDIRLVNQIGYIVAENLHGIEGINIGVTAFPGPSYAGSRYTVTPVLEHGQNMHLKFGVRCTGSTPMGEALWWVMQQMVCQKEPRRVIIIVTDGDPDNRVNTREAVKIGRTVGFEYFGIGVGQSASSILTLLPGTSRIITHIDELGPALFTILRQTLTADFDT